MAVWHGVQNSAGFEGVKPSYVQRLKGKYKIVHA